MFYYDVLHPINVARLLYDMLCVTVRSFSPETLVRKRVKRRSRNGDDATTEKQQQRGRQVQQSSRPGSRTASVNTSLNASAFTTGELPPPVPNRSATDASRTHRHRSRSGGRRERGTDGDGQKGWRHWRSIDVTKQMVLLTHVLRATPVAVLRFFCQVQTDAETLPLLDFSDLGATARQVLCLGVDAVFAPGLLLSFLTARLLLGVAQQYMMERFFFETNLVVRNLRSRRAWRKALGWSLSLSARTITDPIAFSALTPMLLNRVQDFSSVSGPLRYTPAGVSKGLAMGFAGVVLEMMIVPAASQLCQRAIVGTADAAEYLLLRRYARRGVRVAGEAKDDNASHVNSEDERGDGAGSFAGSLNSSRMSLREMAGVGAKASHEGPGAHSREEPRNAERLRRRLEAAERKKAETEVRVIWRAIIYRVCSLLIAQCFVQHPLTVLAHMLYGRAVLNATGLLKLYDDAPAVPLTWTDYLQFLRSCGSVEAGVEQGSGVRAVELLRSIGGFIGYEVSMVSSCIRCFSTRDAAIRALVAHAEQRRTSRDGHDGVDAGPSALESVELMFLSAASLSPLFTAVHFTAIEKLLAFYMDVWVRLRGE
ncbi:hypothetical protein TraAM80_07552 [Trypanosoma rangeli]|uniref:Uncharacterized protein n=1 Tax=Trypanosoma rangeli TaxID=5698 RepID=A0A422N586_TRYRA|nr:uncharacterized protein TraAM80_07552 [Trypanosoma rangeli]RNF00629.1 hypothetical protein TraAM80_07552 [Trypanosoma rangeli]|eukprot:RNF00629.1 hypothetical protein TraAM80_07552 [Trypanosoma rangeli]